jgi:hypothetical protein
MFGSQFQSERKRYLKIMDKWNDVQNDVINREEFNNKTVKRWKIAKFGLF